MIFCPWTYVHYSLRYPPTCMAVLQQSAAPVSVFLQQLVLSFDVSVLQQIVLSLDVSVLRSLCCPWTYLFYSCLCCPLRSVCSYKALHFLKIFTFFVTEECKDDLQEPLTRTWSHSSVRGAVAVGEQTRRLVTDVRLRYTCTLYMNYEQY
jgi:hypothetical protein